MKPLSQYFKRHLTLATGLVALGIVLWSVPAAAAGFFLPTRGVESTGRAGASIAPHQQDLDALWNNPAGLSLVDDTELTVDLGLIGIQTTHQRAPRQMDDGSTREYDPVHNQAPPNTIPSIFVGGPTGHDDISWAAGVYTHYTGSDRYPVDGAQRYVLIDNIGSALGYLHGGVGWQVTDELALGAGIQNFMGNFRIVAMGSGYTGMFGDPEDRDLDMLAEANISSFFNPTANVGLTYWLHDNIQTGLSVQLPHVFRDRDAILEARIPDHPAYDNAELTDDRVDISVPFPFYVRGGIRYVDDHFNVEAAIIYQHWSILDEVVIRPHDAEVRGAPGVESVPVEPFVVPQGFRNTISLHLGGAYSLTPDVELRSGFVYERGAVPDEYYNVFALDPDKHQLSIGGSYDFGTITADATAAAIIMPSKQITNSEVRQHNPSDGGDHSIVVGNGTYDHFGYIVGLGARYEF